jgi:hypothetical protein
MQISRYRDIEREEEKKKKHITSALLKTSTMVYLKTRNET